MSTKLTLCLYFKNDNKSDIAEGAINEQEYVIMLLDKDDIPDLQFWTTGIQTPAPPSKNPNSL